MGEMGATFGSNCTVIFCTFSFFASAKEMAERKIIDKVRTAFGVDHILPFVVVVAIIDTWREPDNVMRRLAKK